ncbi:MmgE/PrpD family protein [Aestuariivita boseongensis]|uniref:MmgE/PrpD family protein n=1 Tax=Aestuariivita boseongensis TaxID=1470562 RepID=UPI000A8C0731|nr:MmgE/PrpD family protein [Aestuariivita boseongensis]
MNHMTDVMDGQGTTLARLSDFALNLAADDIPAPVLERAALLLLDTLGICIASSPMEAGVLARDAATRLFGAGDPAYAAQMLFDGRTVSLAGAVFAAATQTDNLDGHDGFNPVKGHVGVVTVPTLAVLAQHLPDLPGRQALAALVVGYEVAGRAGMALHNTVSDYHTSGAWNALGVVAMAARLRGQSPEVLREALGIAEYHGPRSQMMREIASPTMLHDGSGWGALAGMSAAIMAESGFTGAPAITVEGAGAAVYWADLGQVWQTQDQYIKPYPICRWAHAPIDAARELMLTHDVTHTQIEKVIIRSFANSIALYPDMPDTTSKAQYSLAFAVSAMLVHGHIGLDQISGDGLRDENIARLVAATELVVSEDHEALFPRHRTADVDLVLRDGRVLRSGLTHARGGTERPFDASEITKKFTAFAAPAVGESRASAIRDACLYLTRPDASFRALGQLLQDPL